MFKNEPEAEEEFGGTGAKGETIIGVSAKLEGDFKSEGDVILHGEVSGTITTQGNLEIGEAAIVKANLEGDNIVVSGKVEGSIKARGKMTINTSGKVTGNVEVSSIEIADGGFLNGDCKMGEGQSESSSQKESIDED